LSPSAPKGTSLQAKQAHNLDIKWGCQLYASEVFTPREQIPVLAEWKGVRPYEKEWTF